MKKRNTIVALECYVKKGEKYLMINRNKNKRILPNVWMAPGGKVDFCEGIFECARREILEETGLEIKNIRLKCIGTGYLKDIDYEIYFYMLNSDYKSGKVKQNYEDGELVWLTPKEIYKLPNLLAELHYVLPHILSDDYKVISYKAYYKKGNELEEFVIEMP